MEGKRLLFLLDLDALLPLLGLLGGGAGLVGRDVHLVGRADHDQAAVGAGDGSADQQEVVLEVDLDDVEVPDGDPAVAVLPGGEVAELGPAAAAIAGVRAGAAGGAVDLLGAVGGGQALEVVPLHDARVAAPLAGADDVNV